MKTLVLAVAAAVAVTLLATPASAKEIAGLQLCGSSGCVTERSHDTIATLREGPGGPMSDTSAAVGPARAGDWYRARVLIREPDGKLFAGFSFYYVPGAGRIAMSGEPTATMTWVAASGGWKRVLDRLAGTVDAYGPPRITRVTVDGKPVADPGSWLRVFAAGEPTDRYPNQADLRQVSLLSHPRTPWSDGNNIAFSPSSRILLRDGEIVELPGALVERMRNGASLDDRSSFPLKLVSALAGVGARRAGSTHVLAVDGGRVDQRVVVDARTYLPLRIEWRQDGALVAVTRFAALERQRAPLPLDTWTMSAHPGARVQQITARGRPVHVLSVRPGRATGAVRWLGPSYEGRRARVEDVELTGGHATRIAYGSLVVWNYADVVPPAVIQGRGLQAKVFAIPGGGIVRAHFGRGGVQIAEVAFGDGTVGIISGTGDNLDVVRAAQQLTRPGSP